MRRNIIHLLAFLSGCSVIGMAQSNAVIEYNVPSPHSRPFGITSGPDGALWFTEQYQGKIGRITTTGSFTEYALTAPKTNAQVFPIGITVGPDQALWFAAESYIGRITTGGAVTLFPEGIAGDAVAITNGPDGALWFVDAESVSIGRMPPSGTGVKNFASANAKPNSIVTGPDGNLWFTSYNDQIGRLTPAGVFTMFPLAPGSNPAAITVGPNQQLWFTEMGSNKIGSITTAGKLTEFALPAKTAPNQIALGADGALWFTETTLGRIGRITTSGAFTEFTPPTANSYPGGITRGPDGAVWFVEQGDLGEIMGSNLAKIGKIVPVAAPTITSATPVSATACGPGFTVNLTGSNYQSSTVGVFGGNPAIPSGTALPTSVLSATQLQAFVNAQLIGTPGTTIVYAATPVSTTSYLVSNTVPFQVKPTPLIQTLSPLSVPAGVNTSLALSVTNYIPGTTAVLWGSGGTPLSVNTVTQQGGTTLISVSLPASLTSATGQFPVNVVNIETANPNGQAYSPTSCSPPQTVTVVAGLSITTTSLSTGTVGSPYPSTTMQAQGGTAPLSWNATGLPTNLSMNSPGVLAGTPNVSGTFSVTVNVSDNSNPKQTASKTFTLMVNGSLSISTPALPAGTVGTPYPSTTLQAQGGVAPYTWNASGLPANVSISPVGVLSGTPATAGNFPVTITVSDSSTTRQSASKAFTLTVNGALSITTSSLPGGTVGTSYPSTTLQVQGGMAPFSWTSTGLPTNLSLSGAGVLAGSPNAAGNYSVTVTVSDSSSPKQSAIKTFSLTVNGTFTIATTSLSDGIAATAYSPFTLQAQNGTPPLTWSASGLPGNLSLSPSGVLSGTPNSTGTFTVTVNVSDSSSPKQSASKVFSLSLSLPSAPSLQLTTTGQPAAMSDPVGIQVNMGSPYAYPLTGTLTLTFVPNASGLPGTGYADPGLQFSKPLPGTGGLQVTVPIPTDAASLPLVQRGSVAGDVIVTLTSLTATVNGQQIAVPQRGSTPQTRITLPQLPPAIVPGSVRITNVSGSGFVVVLQANSTPRDLSQVSLTFTPTSGSQLSGTTFPIQLTTVASNWFASSDGRNGGSAFELQIPFNYSGDPSAIGSVSVILYNSVGNSGSVTGSR